MLPSIDSLIDKFASKFRIEQEIVEEKNTVTLITYSYLGSRLLYTHSMSLDTLIDIAVRRSKTADADADLNTL